MVTPRSFVFLSRLKYSPRRVGDKFGTDLSRWLAVNGIISHLSELNFSRHVLENYARRHKSDWRASVASAMLVISP